MKQLFIYFVLLLLPSLCSCQNEEWKVEADALQKEIDLQKEIIKKLKQPTSVTDIVKGDNECVIYLSNGEEIRFGFSSESSAFPVFRIAANECWVVNGTETELSARTTTPYIGDNGNWWIGDTDTGVLPGKVIITGVVEMLNGRIYFHFKDGTTIKMEKDTVKRIAAWGDSLTPDYVPVLQRLLGSSFKVLDCGVPGEATPEIAARQGGVPMKLGRDVKLPAKAGEPVAIGTDKGEDDGYLLTTYEGLFENTTNWIQNRNNVRPFRQAPVASEFSINPCYINGVECRIYKNKQTADSGGGICYIERTADGEAVTLPAGSIVYTSAMKNLRHIYANIFFMGQNGGFDGKDGKQDVNILIDQYRRMIEYSGCNRYIVISYPKDRKGGRELEAHEKALERAFGEHVINLRQYCVEHALEDANIIPTEQDLKDIADGKCPTSILRDGLHFNATGTKVQARLIYNKLKELGYVAK